MKCFAVILVLGVLLVQSDAVLANRQRVSSENESELAELSAKTKGGLADPELSVVARHEHVGDEDDHDHDGDGVPDHDPEDHDDEDDHDHDDEDDHDHDGDGEPDHDPEDHDDDDDDHDHDDDEEDNDDADPCLGMCEDGRYCVVRDNGAAFCVDCTAFLKPKMSGDLTECCMYDASRMRCVTALKSSGPGICRRSDDLYFIGDDGSTVEAEFIRNRGFACRGAHDFRRNRAACKVVVGNAGKVRCIE